VSRCAGAAPSGATPADRCWPSPADLVPGHKWIQIPLRRPMLEQMQNACASFGSFLSTSCTALPACARRRSTTPRRGDTRLPEHVGQRSMVVARCSKAISQAGRTRGASRRTDPARSSCSRRAARAFAARQLQQHLVGQLRNVDRYPHDGRRVQDFEVMAGNLLWSELWQTHSREALVLP